MFNIQDVRLQDLRIYQEIGEEKAKTERLAMVLEMLGELFDEVPEVMKAQISVLTPEQLLNLGKALLRFRKLKDLEVWLAENR